MMQSSSPGQGTKTPHLMGFGRCGSKRIKRVRRNFRDTWKGQAYVVPNLEFEEYPDCGERLFDHAAMQKIEAHSPASSARR